MTKKVSTYMNSTILAKFIEKEMDLALKQMAHLKSSSADSSNLGFYQTYQHIMDDEVTSAVLKFLNECSFDNCINFSYIVLFPNIKNTMKAYYCRLISLCNVIYKLVSKVLAKKLKHSFPT